MSNQPNTPANAFNIEISEEVAEGTYVNLAVITHSVSEFIVDFVSIMPNMPKHKVKNRIIMSPMHTKRFLKALADNIDKFEQSNGTIQDIEEISIPMNFGTSQAKA